jgi:competence protein ComEC
MALQTIAVCAVLCGSVAGMVCLERMRLPDPLDGMQCTVQGVVARVSLTVPGEFSVNVASGIAPAHKDTGRGNPLSCLMGKMLLVQALDEQPGAIMELEPGQRVSIWGRLSLPRGVSNPGGFDYRLYLFSKGVSGTLRCATVSLDAPAGAGLATLVHHVRRSLYLATCRTLPGGEAALLAGIVLGDRGGLADETVEDFRATGLVHVLAVSGLHVHFVLVPVEALLRRVPRPGLRNAARAAALAAYSCLTGMQPSVIRSSIMAFLPGLAVSSGRRCRGLDGLALACLAIIVANPLALFDPGFQLSALATLGLIALPGPREARRHDEAVRSTRQRWASQALGLVSATFSAQAFTLPLISARNDWPLIAFVANPLLVPLMGVLVTTGMAGSVAAALLGRLPAARLLMLPAGGVARLSCAMVRALSRSPPGSIPLPALTMQQTVLYYAVLLAITGHWRPGFWHSPRCRRGAAMFILALVVALWLALGQPGRPSGALRLTFIDVGQGDSALVETPGGLTLLVDAGTERAASAQVLPALRRLGCRRLDFLIITHRHADHAGGAAIVLDRFGAEMVLSGPSVSVSDEHGLVGLPRGTRQVVAGDDIIVGKARPDGPEFSVRALWPCPSTMEQDTTENDRSLVLEVRMGAFSCLLMADAGCRVEQALLDGQELRECYVLKTGHHGSATSTSREFLDTVNPSVAVVSVGPNSFGHPAGSTLSRVSACGASVFRTDQEGATTIVTDGRRVKVQAIRRRESAGPRGITQAAEVRCGLRNCAEADR